MRIRLGQLLSLSLRKPDGYDLVLSFAFRQLRPSGFTLFPARLSRFDNSCVPEGQQNHRRVVGRNIALFHCSASSRTRIAVPFSWEAKRASRRKAYSEVVESILDLWMYKPFKGRIEGPACDFCHDHQSLSRHDWKLRTGKPQFPPTNVYRSNARGKIP